MQSQPFSKRAKTKIVATVGPACRDPRQLAELVQAGVDVFRINMAHIDVDEAQSLVDDIRSLSRELNEPIGILVDLAGPKIRLGELPDGSVRCDFDAEIDFISGESSPHPHELTSNYEALADELAVGNTVLLADGTVALRVEAKQAGRARCRVVTPGVLRSRQGINLPGVRLSVPALGEDDLRHARWAAEAGVDFVSLSFVRSAKDVEQLQSLLAEAGTAAHVVAKIEKPEALDELDAIVLASDAVMVARGDLGVEIDVARVPIEQKRIIEVCHRYQRPVIIATQMLDSMQDAPRPTRAEASDVANAILDGADACMLSGETAIGEYPTLAVETMNRIALVTEAQMPAEPRIAAEESNVEGLHEITRGVVAGAVTVAHRLRAKMIVVASRSGATAQALSNLRGVIRTIGVSGSDATLCRMCLFWGVAPLYGVSTRDVRSIIEHLEQWGADCEALAEGDRIVLVTGSAIARGSHDMLTVHVVGQAV